MSFQLYDHMTWDNSGSISITITETTDPNNPIPEPATLLAGMAGLAGVGRYLRRRK